MLAAPFTEDAERARAWFADDAGVGQDGIIAKRVDQPYLAGERGWAKVKHRSTLDCVVGGYRLSKTGDGIGALLLGLYDDDGHAPLRRAHVVVQGEGAPRDARGAAPAGGRRELRGRPGARRAQPVERRQGHRVGRAPAHPGLRGHDRPHAVRPVPARRHLRAVARGPRSTLVHVRAAPRRGTAGLAGRLRVGCGPTSGRPAGRGEPAGRARATRAWVRRRPWGSGGPRRVAQAAGLVAAASSSSGSSECAVSSMPAPGSPMARSRSGTVRSVNADGSTVGTSSQDSGVETRASGTGRIE